MTPWFSSLPQKPFMMRRGAACSRVENILDAFFSVYTCLTTSRAKAYSVNLNVIVGPLGFLITRRQFAFSVYVKTSMCDTPNSPAALTKSLMEFFFDSTNFVAVQGYSRFLKSCCNSFKYTPILPRFMTNATKTLTLSFKYLHLGTSSSSYATSL